MSCESRTDPPNKIIKIINSHVGSKCSMFYYLGPRRNHFVVNVHSSLDLRPCLEASEHRQLVITMESMSAHKCMQNG
jgi:hypothetical protein